MTVTERARERIQQEVREHDLGADNAHILAYWYAYMDGANAQKVEDMKPGGSYECFHCLTRSVIWCADFDFSDYGYEGEGIVQVCHCVNCGADIEYRIPIPNEEEKEE